MPRTSRTSTAVLPRIGHGASWVPFALLAAVVLVSFALGRGPVEPGHAADVGVTGSFSSDVFIDASACSATAVNIGELVPGTDGWKTAQDAGGQSCSIDFGSANHVGGTTLSMLEDPSAAAGAALKCVVAECAGSSIADVTDAPSEPAVGAAGFGSQLLSATGTATGLWSAAPGVHALGDAASAACATPGIGTGTCAFTWGAIAAATTPSGAYQAQANLIVLAN